MTQHKKKPAFMPGRGYTKKDWDTVDSPEATDAELAQAKPFAEALPDLAASIRRGRGPQKSPTKRLISLRLDGDVVDKFKRTGNGWQSRMNDVLRKAKV